MINRRIAENAIKISENFSFSNKYLSPKAGTPLSAAVSTIVGFQEKGTIDEIISLSNSVNSTVGSYTEVENDIKKNTAKILSRMIFTARNVVNPKIKECMDEIEKWRTTQKDFQVGTLPILKIIDVAPLFTDESFNSMLAANKDSNFVVNMNVVTEALTMLSNVISGEQVKALMKTGSNGVDKKAEEYFNAESMELDSIKNPYNYTVPILEKDLKELIAGFLYLNGICNGKIDVALAVSENPAMTAEICGLRANYAARIHQIINRIIAASKVNDLIIPPGMFKGLSMRGSNTIYVIGTSYRDWLTKGGSVEALLGGFIRASRNLPLGSDINENNFRDFLSDPEKCVLAYNQLLQHRQALQLTNELTEIPRVVGEYLNRAILKSDEENNEQIKKIDRLLVALKNRRYYNGADLVSYIRDVVCDIYVENDSVKRILTDIDQVLKESGKEDMNYSVYVAISRLVGNWIAEQFEQLPTA